MSHALPAVKLGLAPSRGDAPEAVVVTRPAGNMLVELTKARLSTMVLLTTAVGSILAPAARLEIGRLLWTLAGTALAAFGANVLNQCLEASRDALMLRTRGRPLPSGRITAGRAAALGIAMALTGPALLAVAVNLPAAALAAISVLVYVGIYTPLKRVTSLNTLVGAVCGALPPMIGWTAVTGRLEAGAWTLGLLLFIWQIPHFLALAWMYREDYARGGFRMLPLGDSAGVRTFNVAMLYALALLPLGPLAALTGVAGWTAATAVVILGAGFLAVCGRLRNERTVAAARAVFVASLIYLPLVLGLMVADRGVAGETVVPWSSGTAAEAGE